MEKTTGFITDTDCYLFGEGTHYEIYRKLGAHPARLDGKTGVYFAVWAPHAASVAVAGDFNNWSQDTHIMTPVATSGIHELFTTDARPGDLYKFAITTQTGQVLMKADPYASWSELRPGTASRICADSSFQWKDQNGWTRGIPPSPHWGLFPFMRSISVPGKRTAMTSLHTGSWPESWCPM